MTADFRIPKIRLASNPARLRNPARTIRVHTASARPSGDPRHSLRSASLPRPRSAIHVASHVQKTQPAIIAASNSAIGP